MKLLILIFSLLILTSSALAQEIQAELNIISAPPTLKEGDVVEGVLKVWPLENANLDEFKKLENTTLGNLFFITEVMGVEASPNNSEVSEAKVLIIIKKTDNNSRQPLVLREKSINLNLPSIAFTAGDKKVTDYYVLDQGVIYSNLGLIIISLFILLLVLILFFKRKSLLIFVKKFKQDALSNYKKAIELKFTTATKREDFEEIYATRKEWLSLIKEVNPRYDDFFSTMEKHQYKKSWGSDELLEVKNSFEFIRRSFK